MVLFAENRDFLQIRFSGLSSYRTGEISLKEYINQYLDRYRKGDYYPWHMPGHKRQDVFKDDFWENMFLRDFTEAEGLDDLHEPELFMKDSLEQMQRFYGTEKTYMMVNGATGGILTALYACAPEGASVLMGRNCHKSVCHAVSLLNLKPEYVVPELLPGTDIFADITPEQMEQALNELKKTDRLPAVVVITSPTYEGVISDICGIKNVLEPYNIPLIVDEAHGAHLPFMPKRNLSAVAAGADLVIQSTHKTLPSLTQTALLHVNRKELVPKVERYLHIFQTSSPSYLFTQSMEKAVVYAENHPEVFDAYRKRLKHFRKKCKELRHIRLLQPKQTCYAYDKGKLVFTVSGVHPAEPGTDSRNDIPATGPWLAHVLAAEYQQVVEMAGTHHVILMTSFADKKKAFEHLYEILKHIDSELTEAADKAGRNADQMNHADSMSVLPDMENAVLCSTGFHLPEQVMTPGAAWRLDSSREKLAEAEGSIAADYVYAYPPGIAVITPGEKIDGQVIRDISQMVETGLNMIGVEYQTDGIYIPVTEPVR